MIKLCTVFQYMGEANLHLHFAVTLYVIDQCNWPATLKGKTIVPMKKKLNVK